MTGQILGHYRVLERIGSGGMGDVYRATDERLARDVAIKVLKPSLANDPDRLRRFELEARAAAALSHPNIVAIYDIELNHGAPYIVSELLQGQTLRQRLLEGPLSLRQSAEYGMQIAAGLVAAHAKRIVHRDLKPENLFITREGHIKILDFGIAKLSPTDSSESSSIETMATQTKSGAILGTVCYMSPEQIRGKAVDHRSDVFSLGAILYEMVTGQRAFMGETEADTMTAVLKEDPPDMGQARQNISDGLQRIIFHCLEKDPENRFQAVRDLAFALSTAATATTQPVSLPRRRAVNFRRRLPWIVTGLLLLGAGLWLGNWFRQQALPPVTYRRITFQRGTIYSARFSPDSHSILYGAMWNGQPLEVFTTIGDSPLARPLGFTAAHMLALSASNELALVVNGTPDRRTFVDGVLADAPLAGGTPRQILENVTAADWSPAKDLAIVHRSNGQSRLEYPIGKVLYQTAGWVSDIRFSPDGKRIAFMDHPAVWDDRGSVCVTDLAGRRSTLAAGYQSEGGLDWKPGGDEIWFTAADNSSTTRSLWGVSLAGRKRRVLTVPGGITLQDIASDGRVLITMDSERMAMEWTGRNPKDVRDLSWYDWTIAKDISKDGQWVLFEESSEPAGPNYAVAIRNIDGSPPIRLGDGSAGTLSPDGKKALSVFIGSPQHIAVLPVGPGEAREIDLPELEHIVNGSAYSLADGKRIVVQGNLPGQANRDFLVDLNQTNPTAQPITHENEFLAFPSPDGKYQVGRIGKALALFPVEGGEGKPIPLPPLASGRYDVTGWSADGKALYVYRSTGLPVVVDRAEIATGKLSPIRELTPTDRAGVIWIGSIVTTPDGEEFAYSYQQSLSALYVVKGLH